MLKVSIVTSFLNVERFLDETIQSVLHQTYKHWELILIDDGSTDLSSTMAKHYAEKFPDRIIYKDHPGHINKGTGVSRNLALEIASGELIAFLDGDDFWQINYLETMVSLYQQTGAAMVCQASLYWHSWSESTETDALINVGAENNKLYYAGELVNLLYPLGKGYAPCICGLLVERRAIVDCGGFEESFRGMFDDQTLLIKLYFKENVFISSTCNNKYRQRPNSLVHESHFTGRYLNDEVQYFKWLGNYLKTNKIFDLAAYRYIQVKLFPSNYPAVYQLVRDFPKPVKNIVKRLLSV